MKQKLFYLLFVFSIVLSSCQNEKKNEPSVNNNIAVNTPYSYNTYPEPCLSLGSSVDFVQRVMENKGYSTTNKKVDGNYTFLSGLYGTNVGYVATFISGKFVWVDIYLPYSKSITKEVLQYLFERYNFIKEYATNSKEFTEGHVINLFRTKDGKIDIEMGAEIINGSQFLVVYYTEAD